MKTQEIIVKLADTVGKIKDGTVDPGDLDALTESLSGYFSRLVDEPEEQQKAAKLEAGLRFLAIFVG